jgi:hypothetical protein
VTGPEHYQAAEMLLKASDQDRPDTDPAELISAAQVHATLALAAATAMPVGDFDEWREVTKPDAEVPL